VHLLVVPSSNVFEAIVQTAAQLDSAEIIAGLSSVMTAAEQARRMGEAWEKLEKKPSRQVSFRVVDPGGTVEDFSLGAHVPKLTPDEIETIHDLWLELGKQATLPDLHHDDVVAIALGRLANDLRGAKRGEVIQELQALLRR
jgi:hypothetical protein